MAKVKLYLCRHAQAVDGSETLADEERFLTAKGRRQATEVGRALAKHGEQPDVVFTSPLVRAVQTAEGLARSLGFEGALEVLSALAPGGRLSDALEAIAERADERAFFLVGHEPMMSEWAAALLAARFPRAFAKGAVLRLDFDREPAPAGATAKFFLTPERLEREPV